MTDYDAFIAGKLKRVRPVGTPPSFLPDCLKDFQGFTCDWLCRLGRGAVFYDCGLGKSLMEIVACENAVRELDKPALIIAPLAVSRQFVREADKFGMKLNHTQDGSLKRGVNVTNYERLENFDPDRLGKVALDESSILKNFDGHYRRVITDFMKAVPRGSLWSATPAPNDYMEFGGSCEALGVMGRNQMLGTFFTNGGDDTQSWSLKGHARTQFWRWLASWGKAARKPSDLGDFSDEGYHLPPLNTERHVLKVPPPAGVRRSLTGYQARTLTQQREEYKRTVKLRCEYAASLVPKDRQCVVWCHFNPEGDLLTSLIPGAVQVSGSDSDRHKEQAMQGFSDGSVRVLVTKPKIAGFGMNWQNCHDVIYFPTHSHEAYYQAVRRCWRFGQLHPVTCHMITTEPLARVMANMIRKEHLSDAAYDGIVREMGKAITAPDYNPQKTMRLPTWLS